MIRKYMPYIVTAIFLLVNIWIGYSYVKLMTKQHEESHQLFVCQQLSRKLDGLLGALSKDHTMLSEITVSMLNGYTDETQGKSYMEIKEHTQFLSDEYTKVVLQYGAACLPETVQ